MRIIRRMGTVNNNNNDNNNNNNNNNSNSYTTNNNNNYISIFIGCLFLAFSILVLATCSVPMGPYFLDLLLPLLPSLVRGPIFLDTGSQPSDITASHSEVMWCPTAGMYLKVWAGPYNIINNK